MTLSGQNTYTGLTTVDDGKLVMGGAGGQYYLNASDFAISNGGTLSFGAARYDLSNQGTGTPRTITFGSGGGNTFDTGSGVNLVDWKGSTFRTTGGARNFITGSSGVNPATTFTLDVARGTDASTDLLVVSGNLDIAAGTLLSLTDIAGTQAFVAINAVPEPSTYAMTLAGIACGGFLTWRRRKRA